MDSIDELLAKLQPQPKPNPQPEAKKPPSASISVPAESRPALIDALLQNLDRETLPEKQPAEKPRSTAPNSEGSRPAQTQSSPDPLLEQVRLQYEQQDQAEAERQAEAQRQVEQQREQQAREKQQRLEQLKAQRRAELTEKAQAWLKQLKPKSNEGRWFEEFACNYDSRLEAAIDYLEALTEVDPNL